MSRDLRISRIELSSALQPVATRRDLLTATTDAARLLAMSGHEPAAIDAAAGALIRVILLVASATEGPR